MEPKSANTLDIARAMSTHTQDVAECIAMIAFAIAKHLPEPEALIEDLLAVSEPDPHRTAPMAVFFHRFHAALIAGLNAAEGSGLSDH